MVSQFLVTEKTVAAMAQTLGLEVELGSFWKKFKGAMATAMKFATKVANAILTVAPIVAGLLAYHEARWAQLHPSNINDLKKYYSSNPQVLCTQKIAATPIELMVKKMEDVAKPQERFGREMEVRDRDFTPRDP